MPTSENTYSNASYDAQKVATLSYYDAAIDELTQTLDLESKQKSDEAVYCNLLATTQAEIIDNLFEDLEEIAPDDGDGITNLLGTIGTTGTAATSVLSTENSARSGRNSANTTVLNDLKATLKTERETAEKVADRLYRNTEQGAWNTYLTGVQSASTAYLTSQKTAENTYKTASDAADATYRATSVTAYVGYQNATNDLGALYSTAVARAGDTNFNLAAFFTATGGNTACQAYEFVTSPSENLNLTGTNGVGMPNPYAPQSSDTPVPQAQDMFSLEQLWDLKRMSPVSHTNFQEQVGLMLNSYISEQASLKQAVNDSKKTALSSMQDKSGESSWLDSVATWGYEVVLKGCGQGACNIANGIQDAGISLINLPGATINGIAQIEEYFEILGTNDSIRVPYLTSPDWSRNLIVKEPGSPHTLSDTHAWSKVIGGESVVTLATIGLSQLGKAGQLAELGHVTTVKNATAIRASNTLIGRNGIYALSKPSRTAGWNQVRALVDNADKVVMIPSIVSSVFRPIAVVGPISAWTRFFGGYVAPYGTLNLVTGATTPMANSAVIYQAIDVVMGQFSLFYISIWPYIRRDHP